MKVISFDFETPRIGPGAIFPKPICLSWQVWSDGVTHPVQLIGNDRPDAMLAVIESLLAPGHLLVGANSAYDLQVILTGYPHLVSMIHRKFLAREITDVQLREQLICLATHGQLTYLARPDGTNAKLSFTLADLSAKYLGKNRFEEKKDQGAWRMNFHLLDGTPVENYEPEAAAYAKEDSEDTLQAYLLQQAQYEHTGAFKTEFFRTESSFTLACGTRNGLRPDEEAFNKVTAWVTEENSDDKFPELIKAGILIPAEPPRPYKNGAKNKDGTPKMKAAEPSHIKIAPLQAAIVAACKEKGVEPKKTDPSETNPEGGIARGVDDIKEVMSGHPVLIEYVKREEDRKLITTYLPQMTWDGKLTKTVHAPFRALVSTGRTSSSAGGKSGKVLFPAMNGQNQDPRVRPIFVPRPDNYFVSSDIKSLELVTVAQQTFSKFRESKHRDKINAGYDLHAYLGSRYASFFDVGLGPMLAQLSEDDRYSLFKTWEKTDDESPEKTCYKYWRKFAKAPGLGFPGGMGAEKFVTYALNDPYNVDLRKEAQRYLHLLSWNSSVAYYADRMGLLVRTQDDKRIPWTAAMFKDPSILPTDAKTWPPHLQAIGLAALLKELWLETYPEMRAYFKDVPTWKDEVNEGKLFYTSPLGMVRRAVDFTNAANGWAMQTPGAEAALLGWNEFVWECIDPELNSILFGCLPLLFIHDEIFAEVPIEEAHECAMRIKAIMEKNLSIVCPDVAVEANPCLMERWHKLAEPKYVNGKLVPWSPKGGWERALEKQRKK